MSKKEVNALPTRDLWSIVNSTRASGNFWAELAWAKEELKRRYAKRGRRLIGM